MTSLTFVWGSMNSLLSNEVLVRALKWDFHLETRDRDVMSITDKYMSLAIFPTFPPLLQNVISLMSVWLVFSVTFFFVNALFNVSSKASNTRLHRVIFNLIKEFFVEGYKKIYKCNLFHSNLFTETSCNYVFKSVKKSCKVIWQKSQQHNFSRELLSIFLFTVGLLIKKYSDIHIIHMQMNLHKNSNLKCRLVLKCQKPSQKHNLHWKRIFKYLPISTNLNKDKE